MKFDEFVQESMTKTLLSGDLRTGQSMVQAALNKSFEWIDVGDYNRSNGHFKLAKSLWKRHQKDFDQRSKAKELPPFDELVAAAKNKYLESRNLDPKNFDTIYSKARSQKIGELYLGEFDHHHHHHDE